MIELPEQVKKYIIRGWGNAYIGWNLNKVPMCVVDDWFKLAHSVKMTDEEKEYALKLMDGACWEHNGTLTVVSEK